MAQRASGRRKAPSLELTRGPLRGPLTRERHADPTEGPLLPLPKQTSDDEAPISTPVPAALTRLIDLAKSKVADASPPEPTPGTRDLPVGVRRGRLGRRDEPAPSSTRTPSSSFEHLLESAREAGLDLELTETRALLEPWLAGNDVLAFVPNDDHALDAIAVAEQAQARRVLILLPGFEQVRNWCRRARQHGMRVVELSTALDNPEQVIESVRTQSRALVVTAFSSLEHPAIFAGLQRVSWNGVVLDEAQRVSELAHDFDVAYDRFAELLPRLGRPTTLALLRGAAPSVRSDLPHRLGLRNPVRVDLPPVRENLALAVNAVEPAKRNPELLRVLEGMGGSRAVLCTTAPELDELQGQLRRAGHRTVRLDDPLGVLVDGESDQPPILLGVVPAAPPPGHAVDALVHTRAPVSLEQYVRDLGWLRRDGQPKSSVVLVSQEDENVGRAALERGRPRPEELVGVAGVIARHGAGGQSVLLDAICPAVGLNRQRLLPLVSLLVRAGTIELEGEWVRLRPDCLDLVDRARGLAARLRLARDRDGTRMRSVAAYVISRGCRQESLRRHFGTANSRPCGRCDSCLGNLRHRGAGPEPSES